jgi:hypothetical protein
VPELPNEERSVAGIVLIVLVCLVNTALGFVLAMDFGHGPPWSQYPRLERMRRKVGVLLKLDEPEHS